VPLRRATLDRLRTAWTLARGWSLLPAVLALAGAGVAAVLDPSVPLPAYFAPRGYAVPLLQLLTLPVAVTAVLCLEEPAHELWRTSDRPMRVIAAARALVPLALTTLAALPLGLTRAVTIAVVLAALAAEALLLRRFAGPGLAWMLPALHVAGASVFGVTDEGVQLWAWPVAVEPSPPQLVLVAVTITACLAAAHRRRRGAGHR